MIDRNKVEVTTRLGKPTKTGDQNINNKYLMADKVIYSISKSTLEGKNRVFPQVDIISLDLITGKESVIYSQNGIEFLLADAKYFLRNNAPYLLINLETKLLVKNLLTEEVETIFDTKKDGTIPEVLVFSTGDSIYFTVVHFYDDPQKQSPGAYTIYKYDLMNRVAKVLIDEKEGERQTAKVPYKFSDDQQTIYYRQYYPSEGILTFWQSDLNGNNFKDTNLTSLDVDNKMKSSKIKFFDSGEGMAFCGRMIEEVLIHNSIKIGTKIILSSKNTEYLFLKRLTEKYSLLQEKRVIEETGFGPPEENIVKGRKCGSRDEKSAKEFIVDETTGQVYNLPTDNEEIKQITDPWYILLRNYSELSSPTTLTEYVLEGGKVSIKELLSFDIQKDLQIISLVKNNQPSNVSYFEF